MRSTAALIAICLRGDDDLPLLKPIRSAILATAGIWQMFV